MLNKAQIIGRVGKDPEIKYLPNGKAIANFSLATSESHKDKQTGEKVEKTEWHNISAFERLAEIIGEYVKKGDLLYIEGKIQTRKYEKNGVTNYATGIVASEMKMLGSKDGNQQQQEQPRQQNKSVPVRTVGFEDEDVPF